MRVAWFLMVACLGAAPGCGGSSSSEAGAGTGGSNAGRASGAELEPAPNLDVTTCAAIREASVNASTRCSDCCMLGSVVVASSFIYREQCTCAQRREADQGGTICASAIADGDTCSTCCRDHDFTVSGWLGSGGATAASCGCGSQRDATVCQASAQSETACGDCCMHEGFIGTAYGSGSCVCYAP